VKKQMVVILISIVLAVSLAYGEDKKVPVCKSKYAFPANCTACHIPPYGAVGYPLPSGVTVTGSVASLYIEHIDFQRLRDLLLILQPYQTKKLSIDIFSFGGSLFDAMAMVALLREEEKAGKVIEIKARGLIASAGLIVMLAGTKDARYIDKDALVMFHELQSYKFFAIETPSGKEQEAEIYRTIQNTVNNYIVSRSKITMEELCSKIKNKEFWLKPEDAVKYGFADKVMK